MDFKGCVLYCAGVPEFVENFDRLNGTHLAQINKRSPIEKMIDDACDRGYDDDMAKFIQFVFWFVWMRLPPEALENPTPFIDLPK